MKRALLFAGFLWSLPNTIIGIIVSLVVFGSLPTYLHRKYLTLSCIPRRWPIGRYVAVTLGNVVLYKNGETLCNHTIFMHEMEHVRQGMILGPLHFVLYGLASLLSLALYGSIYRYNWFEIQARRAAGEVV